MRRAVARVQGADMTGRSRLIATLGACGMTAAILAALVWPTTVPASAQQAAGAPHNHMDHMAAAVASVPTFYSEMAGVNARMHADMQVTPTGDVDRDFIRMMIPHHQGAIDMARLLLKYGHDEKLKRLAQSIIVEQGQEIAYMRMLLDPPHAETIGASRADH
jgi:uncharacterized protein (DUF305 family)